MIYHYHFVDSKISSKNIVVAKEDPVVFLEAVYTVEALTVENMYTTGTLCVLEFFQKDE